MSSFISKIERLFSKSEEQTTETPPPETVNVSSCNDNVEDTEEISQPAMSSFISKIERLFSKSEEQTTETPPPETVNVSSGNDDVEDTEEIRQPAMSSFISKIERLFSKSEEQTTETPPPETVNVSSGNDDVEDTEEIRQPAGTQKLAGTVNWGTATTVAIFAGMLYGGSREAAASVSKDAEVTLKLGSITDKREQYRLMRDAMEKRLIRVTRGSIVGGVRLGIFTATFYGLQNLFAEKRGIQDVYNIAAAGSATSALFGLIMPGPLPWRARNVMMGSVLGAAFCFPLGWAHLKLVEKANKGRLDEKGEVTSGVAAAIERLEGSMSK